MWRSTAARVCTWPPRRVQMPVEGALYGCLLFDGGALVELGNGAGADGNVTVDLTGAEAGTYTAFIELTATIR